MKLSQFLLDRVAAWLADNHSSFQLKALFAKYDYRLWEATHASKYRRTVAALSHLVAAEDSERIVADILERVGERVNWKMLNGQAGKVDRQLLTALRADGLSLVNGRVVPAPPLGQMSEAMNLLNPLVESLGWEIAKGHLAQALDNFSRGNWAACNSQIRAMLEDVFNRIAATTQPDDAIRTGGNARRYLQARGSLSTVEADFIQAWFNILHTSGAHPGLSSAEDTRWRLFVTTATAFWAIKALLPSPVAGRDDVSEDPAPD